MGSPQPVPRGDPFSPRANRVKGLERVGQRRDEGRPFPRLEWVDTDLVPCWSGWSDTTLRPSHYTVTLVRGATKWSGTQGTMQAAARQVASRMLRGAPQRLETVSKRGFAAGETRKRRTDGRI